MDAIWADDFHHHVRALLTHDRDGYYAAYEPTVAALAHVIERGWSYEGQLYGPWDRARGAPADALPAHRFVYCIENHDQAGNRALGERLSQVVTPAAFCAATALLLFLPMSPLLLMGQEWGAQTPFLYFTDHDSTLGEAVTRGRLEEFKAFRSFSDPKARERIPNPQDPMTFERSKLRWQERDEPGHVQVLSVVQKMLWLRRNDPVLSDTCRRSDLSAHATDDVLTVERSNAAGRRVLLANFTSRELPVDRPTFDHPIFATAARLDEPLQGSVLAPQSAIIFAV
jgi:maltooligosyltrehalose trehalohydrolase